MKRERERNSIDKRKQIERNENIYVKAIAAFDNSLCCERKRKKTADC